MGFYDEEDRQMRDIKDKSLCCGCTACMAVCPHDAVSMKEDVLGFRYPVVDPEKCTGCGLCDDVCDFQSAGGSDIPLGKGIECFAAVHKDRDVLSSSQSGGAFTALSDVVLKEGGVVYGACFNDDFSVSHRRAASAVERDRMRGSKYVQSDMGDMFRQVRNDLAEGRKVLFCGTPCQVAGLRSYLPEKLHSGLILLDFICHGVPSPSIWKDYLAYQGGIKEFSEVCFRDKRACGWKIHKESFTSSDGSVRLSETYKVLFYKNIMLRDSCGRCPYDIYARSSDITLADFWGIGEVMPELDGKDGVSMVICRTSAGEELFSKAGNDMDCTGVNLLPEFFRRKNPNVLCPAKIYKERGLFEKKYAEKGFLYVARRWGDLGWRYKVWKLKKFLKSL